MTTTTHPLTGAFDAVADLATEIENHADPDQSHRCRALVMIGVA